MRTQPRGAVRSDRPKWRDPCAAGECEEATAGQPFEFHLPTLEEMRSSPDGLEMIRMIDDDNFQSALVSGCPGSGKTTVSIYRLIRLSNQGIAARLLTFHNMLVLSIRNLASVQGVAHDKVSTFHRWQWNLTRVLFDMDSPPRPDEFIQRLRSSALPEQKLVELIVDEGQDLPPVIYKALPTFFDRVFVGADNGQQVHKQGATVERIEQLLRERGNLSRFLLSRNFRNTYETYRFARQFIPKTNILAWDEAILDRLDRSNRHGPKPIVVSFTSENARNNHLKISLENADGNVAILCPYGPHRQRDSSSGECVDDIHGIVAEMGFKATKYHNSAGVPSALERFLVTTFKSSKGMEFDVVIVPRLNCTNPIRAEWYVACTRARRQLIVYRDLSRPDCDPTKDFDPDTYDRVDLQDETSETMPAQAPLHGQGGFGGRRTFGSTRHF